MSENKCSGGTKWAQEHRQVMVLLLVLLVMVGIVSPVFMGQHDYPGDRNIYEPDQAEALPRAVEGSLDPDVEDLGDDVADDSGDVNPEHELAAFQMPVVPEPDIHSMRIPGILDHYTVVGYYGNPNSTRMGILGEHSIERLAELLDERAQEFIGVNGDRGVKRAFHLIFGTVWPDANIGRLSRDLIMDYITFARENDMIVILDHQIGRFSVEQSIREMLPYLIEGPVHLAIDPEWRTSRPGEEIGWVYAREVNNIQQIIQDYLVEHGIFERRMLIVHQFHPKMIQNRDDVQSHFPLVDLVLNADGFGPPALKIASWSHNAGAENIPLQGFKLFYPKAWKSVGFDFPLMTPEEVMALKPQPVYINYQ